MENYKCPDCGFKPPVDKIYYIKNDKIKKKSLDDVMNFEDDDNEYWPKLENVKTQLIDEMFEGTDWTEVHYCPNCKKEFKFNNANY